MANGSHAMSSQLNHPIDYALALSQSINNQFQASGIGNSIAVNTVLGFMHDGKHQCCVFEGALQPRLLDDDHYYVALGIGKLSADPFMRFLVDVFCSGGQPNVREAIFLAAWVIQYSIDTTPAGVAGPIRIATLETGGISPTARELPDTEIAEHQQAMESAASALRKWRDEMQSGAAAKGLPAIPSPPAAT